MAKKKTVEKMSVAKALQELNCLKKVDIESELDYAQITEIYSKESATGTLADKEEPTSDTLNQETETGYGFNVPKHSNEDIDSKIENANLKVETKIKDDIHSIKDKCSSISLGISLSVCGIISAILIAVMIYMNSGLKNDISVLRKDVMAKIDVLNDAIEDISSKIVNSPLQKNVTPNLGIKHNIDKNKQ